MAGTDWRLQGDYFENCSCDVLCPCLLSQAQAPPTDGECNGVLAFHVETGHLGATALDGCNVAVLFSAPGPMAQGNWTTAVYVDEATSAEQGDALAKIVSGAVGGPTAMIAALTSKNLGVKRVPMRYRIDGGRRHFEIPGLVDMNVEAIAGANGDAVWFENVVHPVASRLAAAKGTKTTIRDHGFAWDNTGKNGHFAPFDWRP